MKRKCVSHSWENEHWIRPGVGWHRCKRCGHVEHFNLLHPEETALPLPENLFHRQKTKCRRHKWRCFAQEGRGIRICARCGAEEHFDLSGSRSAAKPAELASSGEWEL